MWFEPSTVFLRRICLGHIEVLRGIYAGVRDRNWGTVPPRLQNLEVTNKRDAFELSFEVDCQSPGIHFRWKGTISGDAQGTVIFGFAGEALSTFLRNRIGICVLHPIRECCGTTAKSVDTRGVERLSVFPKLIEPQILGAANFSHLKKLSHQIQPRMWAEVTFEGEEFETEDQRNWTDASFKTYCTPLEKPFPVQIAAGTRVTQRVTLRLAADPPSEAGGKIAPGIPIPDRKLVLDLRPDAARPVPLPLLGVGFPPAASPLTASQITQLKALGLAHLRVDVTPGQKDAEDILGRGLRLARSIGAGLELALQLPRETTGVELARLTEVLQSSAASLIRVIVFNDGNLVTTHLAVQQLRARLPTAAIGGGSNAHFCELNRARVTGQFSAHDVDFVSWPLTPQVHAFDNLSILENLEAQADTVASARVFCGDKPLVISPVTLKPRFNAVATTGEDALKVTQTLPPCYDTRQMSQFTAAWTLASLAGLAKQGVTSITYFETHGWGGLMQAQTGVHLQDFPVVPGMLYPVYQVFAALTGFQTCAPFKCHCDGEAVLAGMRLFKNGGQERVILAELSGQVQPIEIHLPADFSLRLLHPAMADGPPKPSPRKSSSVELPPHAMAVIELRR
jgi:hypothetical protein